MDAYSWFRRSIAKLKKTSFPTAAAAISTEAVTATASANPGKSSQNKSQEEEEKIYGITEQLIEIVKSFSLETFRNFVLPDEKQSGCDGGNSGNVLIDLSDWQETHAMLVLSRVKELAQLRFQLCPRYLKERQFWRIYFTLVRSYVAQYELQAVRLAKLKQIISGSETVANKGACEVEMSEAKLTSSLDSATSMEENKSSNL